MSSSSNTTGKFAPPSKKSIFERQKEEAEAKKARDQAETAAVYEDFIKSFEHDDDTFASSGRPTRPERNPGVQAPGPGKRHFTTSSLKSGPGSLEPQPGPAKSGPGSLGPGPGFAKKRHYDDYSGHRDRNQDRDRGYRNSNNNGSGNGRHNEAEAFERDEHDRKDADQIVAAARPTLHVSSLPPGTSPAVVKALFAHTPLNVEAVRIMSGGSNTERQSLSAIVTLATETPAADMDSVVSHLQNKYLGFGFNLVISRYLSSAALGGSSNVSASVVSGNSLPFGAKPIQPKTSLSRAPPPGQAQGRFAPPASYTSSSPYGSKSQSQVIVQIPSDLRQMKIIHKTVEALLTYGPEFEALLMSRPHIQRDERWAWLWDSRSVGGVYYRWRLWEILTDTNSKRRQSATGYGAKSNGDILFEGQSPWLVPENGLQFEYTTQLEEFISDDDYNSSDEEADEEGGIAKRYNDHNNAAGKAQDALLDMNDGLGYLNPLAKTKLVHLLTRLPESSAKLRKGDVARITSFAFEHAGAGADEVATLITRNVVKPFTSTKIDEDDQQDDNKAEDKKQDTTTASLVGLYVISDILSSSASAGVRHAWRYRALFENSLRGQKVLEKLGRAEKDLGWGKLKAEKWKRSIQNLLGLWEGWCVFPQASHEEFVDKFLNPPLTERENRMVEAEQQTKADADAQRSKSISKWRSVDGDQGPTSSRNGMEVDGRPMADEDDNIGSVIDDEGSMDENIDGVPMVDSSDEEMVDVEDDAHEAEKTQESEPVVEAKQDPASAKRQRPKAVDMFADDSE